MTPSYTIYETPSQCLDIESASALELIRWLDAQLAVLEIEGVRSELTGWHDVYEEGHWMEWEMSSNVFI